MTVKADSKKRIVLPECKPGEVFEVTYLGAGHYKLARLKAMPAPDESAKKPGPPPEPQ